MQHALLGDKFGAEEALKLGFVSCVVDSIDEGVEFAKTLVKRYVMHLLGLLKVLKIYSTHFKWWYVEEGLKSIAEYNAVNITDSKMKL